MLAYRISVALDQVVFAAKAAPKHESENETTLEIDDPRHGSL